MSMERELNQKTCIKLYEVAIDNQKKRLGWKIIQVWTKPQNPRRPIGCEKFHEDVCLAIWRNWIWKKYEEDQLNWIEFSITSPLSPSYCFDLIFVWANT